MTHQEHIYIQKMKHRYQNKTLETYVDSFRLPKEVPNFLYVRINTFYSKMENEFSYIKIHTYVYTYILRIDTVISFEEDAYL